MRADWRRTGLLAACGMAAAASGVATPLVAPAVGGEPTALEIIKKSEEFNSFGLDGARATVTMDLVKGTTTRSRKLEVRSMKEGDLVRSLMKITYPPELAGMSFLTIENSGRDDDQFIYLPEIGKPKRIVSTERGGSLFGSDFTYADMAPRDSDEATHIRLADESPDGVPCFVIESVDKKPELSEYSKTITYVRKSDFMPKQMKLFDKKGVLFKFLALDPPVSHPAKTGTRLVVKKMLMANLVKKTQTRMTVETLDLTATFPPALFTPGSLGGS